MSQINEIGNRFDTALSVLNVTNKQIAEHFNTSSQNISNLKKTDKINDLISRIAVYYGININWLATGQGDMFTKSTTSNNQTVDNNSGINALNNYGEQNNKKDNLLNFDKDILQILKTVSTVIKSENKESFKKHLKSWIVENI